VPDRTKPPRLAFAALLVGNLALAFGPWLVRLADVGPVASGFWRLAIAVPLLLLLSRVAGQSLPRLKLRFSQPRSRAAGSSRRTWAHGMSAST